MSWKDSNNRRTIREANKFWYRSVMAVKVLFGGRYLMVLDCGHSVTSSREPDPDRMALLCTQCRDRDGAGC